MMNKKLGFLDIITIISFGVGIYALYLTIENLKENESQTENLENILVYLESHLKSQDDHLEKQDEILRNLTGRGESND